MLFHENKKEKNGDRTWPAAGKIITHAAYLGWMAAKNDLIYFNKILSLAP